MSKTTCVMPDAMFLVNLRPFLHSAAPSQVLRRNKEQNSVGENKSLLTSSRAKVGTIDENCTYAESPEEYGNSKYYSPGYDPSPKSCDHLMEKEKKANFDCKDRCPG